MSARLPTLAEIRTSCLHCGHKLEPDKRGGHNLARDAKDDDKVCRFCRANFKGKCNACAKDLPHVEPVLG